MAGAGRAMQAAVLHEPGGPLVIEDVPRPEPGPDEALVRVRACGLGLTLAWNRAGGRGGRIPRIMGHEIAGDVVQVGDRVERVRVGDRVCVYYYLTCGSCRWCRRGLDNLCADRRGHVGRDVDGGLAEFVSLPAANLCPIPAGVGDVEAALAADAIATALHVIHGRARVEAGESVLVVGAGGGVGVHVVQVARLHGAVVIAVDIDPDKLRLASEAGADHVVDASASGFDVEVARLTGGAGVDVVVELVSTDDTLRMSAACLGTGGRLVLVGSYDRRASLPVRHASLRGEASVLSSQYCTRSDLERALSLLAQGRLRAMATRLCSLADADRMLRSIERKEVAGRACVVFP
jgi:propanol-preferring alcohol dehydrogenase